MKLPMDGKGALLVGDAMVTNAALASDIMSLVAGDN